jgi:hypothetical protein
VGEGGVEIPGLGGAQALFGHDQFHEVADIADEALREFGRAPLGRAGPAGLRGVEVTDPAGAGGEGGEGFRGGGHRGYFSSVALSW